MNNPRIREHCIENGMKTGDLKKAEELAKEGIKIDRKDKPGLADDWVDWLMKIAMKQNDREAIIMHARYLMFKANRDYRQYYGILYPTFVFHPSLFLLPFLLTACPRNKQNHISPSGQFYNFLSLILARSVTSLYLHSPEFAFSIN